MLKHLPLIIAFGYIFIFTSCTYDNAEEFFPEENCGIEEVFFQKDILPLFNLHCNNNVCHGGSFPQARVSLISFAGVVKVAKDGRLMGTVRHLDGFNPMPVNGEKLSNCEIEKIQTWINNGTPEN